MDLLLKASVHLIEMRLLDRDLPIANGIRRAVDSGILRGHQGPLLTCMGDRQPYANPTALRTPVSGVGWAGGDGIPSDGLGEGWGLPVSPIVLPVRAGPSRALPSVASLRDGLRPPLTDRPEPESRKTAGKPPKKRDGRSLEERVPQR
ncbi:hypothetical protein GCM10017750_40280 [Streptomyces racemochromogenes]